jgi:hypothetical protein
MELASTISSGPAVLLRLKNAVAAIVLTIVASGIYAAAPYNERQMQHLYGWVGFSFTGAEFLFTATSAYCILLLIYFLADPAPGVSKSLRCFRVATGFARSPVEIWQRGLAPEDRLALLVTLLKAFFGPLMTMSLMAFMMGALLNGRALLAGPDMDFRQMFDQHGYWFAIKGILFVDTLIFTVGYLVEMPRLRNEIRSVDPTLMGWGAAMICYPPFNHYTSLILGSPVSDFPQFDNPMAHLALNILLITLMAIYASASVALGLKASNLTHRGIIGRGPYGFIRHPAYVCKNLAWWIGSGPLIAAGFAESWFKGVTAVASIAGWSMIYILRALTEEDHLRKVDGEYAAYAAKVRYRFLPGIV